MKSTTDPAYCKVQIPWGGFSTRSSQCSRKPKFEGYCRQHSPAQVEIKNAERQKKFEHGQERRRQERLGPDAIRALKSVHRLLEQGMEESAHDVTEAWFESNKF